MSLRLAERRQRLLNPCTRGTPRGLTGLPRCCPCASRHKNCCGFCPRKKLLSTNFVRDIFDKFALRVCLVFTINSKSFQTRVSISVSFSGLFIRLDSCRWFYAFCVPGNALRNGNRSSIWGSVPTGAPQINRLWQGFAVVAPIGATEMSIWRHSSGKGDFFAPPMVSLLGLAPFGANPQLSFLIPPYPPIFRGGYAKT